jgi:hypothetical protein
MCISPLLFNAVPGEYFILNHIDVVIPDQYIPGTPSLSFGMITTPIRHHYDLLEQERMHVLPGSIPEDFNNIHG